MPRLVKDAAALIHFMYKIVSGGQVPPRYMQPRSTTSQLSCSVNATVMTHSRLSVLVIWWQCHKTAAGRQMVVTGNPAAHPPPPHFLAPTPPQFACCHNLVSHAYCSHVLAGPWSLQVAHAYEYASALQQHNIVALIAADMDSCGGQWRAARGCPYPQLEK